MPIPELIAVPDDCVHFPIVRASPENGEERFTKRVQWVIDSSWARNISREIPHYMRWKYGIADTWDKVGLCSRMICPVVS